MAVDLPLVERKQRRARQRIVTAADDLFAARGFDAVSVNDIAERAEVGRTTFFRHFGDKQEVVFAREQELLDLITAELVVAPGAGQRRSAAGALQALEPVVLGLCERMTVDLEGYRRHLQLVDDHADLRARDAAKMRGVARRFGELLVERGWDAPAATFAGEVALACYWAARHAGTGPESLVEATRDAFQRALALGADRSAQPSSGG